MRKPMSDNALAYFVLSRILAHSARNQISRSKFSANRKYALDTALNGRIRKILPNFQQR